MEKYGNPSRFGLVLLFSTSNQCLCVYAIIKYIQNYSFCFPLSIFVSEWSIMNIGLPWGRIGFGNGNTSSLLTLNKTINAKSDKYCNLRYHAASIFSTLSGVFSNSRHRGIIARKTWESQISMTNSKIPWLFSKFQISLTNYKIPWLFPDLEFPWLFPDQWQPCYLLTYLLTYLLFGIT